MQMHMPASPIRASGYSILEGSPEFDDLGAHLDEAEALGVDLVELPAYAWHLIVGGRLLTNRLDDLVRALAGRRLAYSMHGTLAINLMDIPERLPRHEAVLAANIEIAAAIGAHHLVMHTGHVSDPADDVEVAYSRQREALVRAGDHAARLGVLLCVENIFRFRGVRETATPAKLAGELSAIEHPAVRATLDVSHGYIRCTDARLDPIAEMAQLAPYVAHFHLHDSFGRPTEMWTYHPAEAVALGEGDLHLPIGWGSIDWDAVIEAVQPPAGAVAVMELEPRHWRELKDQVGVLQALAARFRSPAAIVA
ncbi:sugar phosphate isomerase/epimerase family protein [Ancylobacter sp. SL191]|uniref:sugar phosphate isomerase/epimerase family protein n=1 Tax=Ancylobacter sp. SL191 TaxID=2995166 RepID=UPI002271EF6F|nr:sugar phosphate isomerase/epimerase family protein [Ancylobacter sp. SL191]WAC28200.1 sugar phosphate isomerase/epimerase [Ancylobacter sp. SL191]